MACIEYFEQQQTSGITCCKKLKNRYLFLVMKNDVHILKIYSTKGGYLFTYNIIRCQLRTKRSCQLILRDISK